MLIQRWLLGTLIILIPCITVTESKGFFDNIMGGISNAASNAVGTISDVAGQAVDSLKNTTTNVAGTILDIKDQAVNTVYNKTSDFACNLQVIDPEWLVGKNISTFVRDMQRAIREGKTQEWIDSVNKMFNIPRVVDEIKTSKITKVTCLACKFLLTLAESLMWLGQDDRTIANTATTICTLLGSYFEAKDPSVCKGLMDGIGMDAIFAIRHAHMRPAQMCQMFFGEECVCGYHEKHDWALGLPKMTLNKKLRQPTSSGNRHFKGLSVLKVLQITDIHFDPYYQPGSESDCDMPACCRGSVGYPSKSPETSAGIWGDYRKCDSPLWLIRNAFAHIAETHKDLDYILWTGDVPPHDIWNQSRAENIKNFKFTTNLIKEYFPNTKVLPVVGNHESFPIDSFVPPSLMPGRDMTFLYEELAKEWSDWLPESALETVRYGGYYSFEVKPGFRVLSVNGNYCGRNNFLLMIKSFDPYNQLGWLITQLEEAEMKGEKVHIINHVPPGGPDCLKAWSHNYYDIINRFKDTIVAQFYGHTHFDEFEVFYDTTDFKRATGVAYIAPSITPWKDCNPAYRIYYIDDSSDESNRAVIDFETWKMDLDKANRGQEPPRWYKGYTARSVYNMESLEPQEWSNLIDRMASNKTLFDIYHRNYYRDTPTRPECNESCRRDFLCNTLSARSHDKKTLCHNLLLS